jgi:AcrR family transcriptional regulator
MLLPNESVSLWGMETGTGLRQRKKQQTRQLIFETATRLFAAHGFDAVTVAEVARAADVSEMTVFNYFQTKEDLCFAGMEFFEQRLLDAVHGRAADALEAFRRVVLDGCSRLADEEGAEVIANAAALIGGSPALQVREREIVTGYTQRLAELLAAETGAPPHDVESSGVAHALMGTQRALVAYVRSSVLAGRRGAKLAADARSQARRAFARLDRGLAGYPIRSRSDPEAESAADLPSNRAELGPPLLQQQAQREHREPRPPDDHANSLP